MVVEDLLSKTVIGPVLLYSTECWAVKKQNSHKLSIVEIRMLRWISEWGNLLKGRGGPYSLKDKGESLRWIFPV